MMADILPSSNKVLVDFSLTFWYSIIQKIELGLEEVGVWELEETKIYYCKISVQWELAFFDV